jgi:hypothetical protein
MDAAGVRHVDLEAPENYIELFEKLPRNLSSWDFIYATCERCGGSGKSEG